MYSEHAVDVTFTTKRLRSTEARNTHLLMKLLFRRGRGDADESANSTGLMPPHGPDERGPKTMQGARGTRVGYKERWVRRAGAPPRHAWRNDADNCPHGRM